MHTKNPYFPAFGDLHRELNNLFEAATESEASPRTTWTPKSDVVEYEDRFEIRMDLPGVKRENIEIAFEGETLEISGDREIEGKESGRAFYRCECASGPFSRKFRFPSRVSASDITARLESGVLLVSVPKAEEAKARTISIN